MVNTTESRLPESAELVIIGAGVSGCSIAREAVKHTRDVVILEKESDVAEGTTKANNAEVHSGIGEKYGTLKQRLNVRGNYLYDEFVEGLGVFLKRQGLMIVITPRTLPEKMTSKLPRSINRALLTKVVPRLIMRNGRKKGIPGQRMLTREEIFEMEPHVTKNALAAVFDPTYGLVSPYKLTIALAENAVQNGARVFLNTEVTGVRVEGGKVNAVVTDRGEIRTGIIVNAAGVFADDIAQMAGSEASRSIREKVRASFSTGTSPAITCAAAWPSSRCSTRGSPKAEVRCLRLRATCSWAPRPSRLATSTILRSPRKRSPRSLTGSTISFPTSRGVPSSLPSAAFERRLKRRTS